MGIFIILVYLAFISFVLFLSGLVSNSSKTQHIKLIILLLGLLVSASPVLYLYIRDLNISGYLSEYCQKHNGANIVSKLPKKTIQLSDQSGESRDLWRVLFDNPDTKVLIKINQGHLVKSEGLYIFSALPKGSVECADYYDYVDQQSERMKANLKRGFAAFSDLCIGTTRVYEQEDSAKLTLDEIHNQISRNTGYVISEKRSALIDESTGQELAYLQRPFVDRNFTLFEFSTLFKIDNSCPKKLIQPEYELLSALLAHQEQKFDH
jgi:hypothetical protein